MVIECMNCSHYGTCHSYENYKTEIHNFTKECREKIRQYFPNGTHKLNSQFGYYHWEPWKPHSLQGNDDFFTQAEVDCGTCAHFKKCYNIHEFITECRDYKHWTSKEDEFLKADEFRI